MGDLEPTHCWPLFLLIAHDHLTVKSFDLPELGISANQLLVNLSRLRRGLLYWVTLVYHFLPNLFDLT